MPRLRTLLAGLLLVGVGGVLGATGTFSAFGSQAETPGNRLATGTVVLGDDDTDTRMFDVASLHPDDAPAPRCIAVRSSGSLAAEVRIHATSAGALPPHLTIKLERGTLAEGLGGACTGFAADAANHSGLGPGVLANRTLASFPSSWATAIADPGSWSNGTVVGYRLTPTLSAAAAAQGENATFTVTWEARQA